MDNFEILKHGLLRGFLRVNYRVFFKVLGEIIGYLGFWEEIKVRGREGQNEV